MKEEGITFKTGVVVGVDVNSKEFLNKFDAIILNGGSSVPRDLKAE
jgi:glutamate synthase (NADPH/NADH) small chain